MQSKINLLRVLSALPTPGPRLSTLKARRIVLGFHLDAANRDPRVFNKPNEFDISRKARRHMSFGLGTHFCVGAPTARLEAEVVLEVMLERMPDLRMLNSGERIKPFGLLKTLGSLLAAA